MASANITNETIANGTMNECSKEVSDSESGNTQEEVVGSDGGSDSPPPSVFAKFYEAKARGIYDTRNQDVVAFIEDTMTSDSKKEDRAVLMTAYVFLVDSHILDANSTVASVTWSSSDANSRRVMHKLCEFYGLNHNIRGASEPNSMTIERKHDKFRTWEFSLQELGNHLQEKQNIQTKTILKRSVDTKTVSKTSGSSKDLQTQSLQSYDERQRNYNAVKQKLGIVSDDNPHSMIGRPVIRRNNRLSPDEYSVRKQALKQISAVPPLMGPVYEPLQPTRPYQHYMQPSMPIQQQCVVLRRCPLENLSSSDINNAFVFREGRWHELIGYSAGETMFSPCDELNAMFLNSKQPNLELFTAPAYQAIPASELHVSDGSDSYNGTPKVLPSPMLPSGLSAQMISSVNGSYAAFQPQTFNHSTTPGLPVNGQSHGPVGGPFVPNTPYFHPTGAPTQAQQHPPQSLTPQEHMRSSMSMSQLSQNTTPSAGDPSGPITNGPVVYAAPTQQILSDLTNRAAASSGPNGGQGPPQGIIVGIQPSQAHTTGAPPPPVTGTWPVGANGPPPPAFASASHQFVTQSGTAVGHVLRPAAVPPVSSSAPSYFASIPHKLPAPNVIQQGPAGTQGIGFSAIHPSAGHIASQSAPHRAFMGQPLMQVNMASSIPGPSYNNHRNGRRGPLSRQNSHNGTNGADGANATSGNCGAQAPNNPH